MLFARCARTVATVCLFAVPLLLVLGCPPSAGSGVSKIGPAEAQALIQDNRNDPDFVILDVRTPEEFAAGHIAGAVNLSFPSSTFSSDVGEFDKSKTYLVYCRSDNRSGQAAAQMSQQGFAQLYDLDGGINEWQAKGLPVVQ